MATEKILFDIPRVFVPLKPEILQFETVNDYSGNDSYHIKISHDLAKKGLTIISDCAISSNTIEVVVVNLNGIDMIVNGLSASMSQVKYGMSGFNNMSSGTIKTRKDELFFEIHKNFAKGNPVIHVGEEFCVNIIG